MKKAPDRPGMRPGRAVFNYIEHELYCYQATRQELEVLREEIIAGATPREVAVAGGWHPDPTGRKAVRLLTNAALARMTRVVRAVDRALARLDESHRRLFVLRYQQCRSWPNVCQEMALSERSYFRLRRELVLAVAYELGLVTEIPQA